MKRTLLFAGALALAAIAACGTDEANPLASPATTDAGPDTSAPPATCIATTCNGHGTCAVTGATTTCACEPGYGGANCTECAAGAQDKDGNKTCAPACSETTCNGHGTCDDSTGLASCVCNAGYAGTNCESCATDYQDKDNDKTCTPACLASTCNGHGTCVDTTGTAVCTCSGPYIGAHCETTPTCQLDSCNGRGTCADDTGSIVCTCETGYAAPTCASCDTGFQDNDNNLTCTASCTGSSCNGHGTCSDTSGTATCTCDTGWDPAADCASCVAGKGGPNCDYDQVYGLDIPLTANWDTSAQVPYDVDNSAAAGSFTRVAYRMVLGTETVWVEMDAFTTDKSKLGIPTDWVWDQSVANVSVVSTAANTPSVAGPVSGLLEFWPNCYARPGGDDGKYDYDDDWAPYGTDCYGSFQVHIGTNTVFAYNRWTDGGNADSDLGFGNRPTNDPDWTFAVNAASYATRRLDVYVK